MNYTKKGILVFVGVAAVIIAGFFLYSPSNEEILCKELQTMNYRTLNGIVEKKYIDEDEHLNKIIELNSFNRTERPTEILNLTLDSTRLFELIEVGDTLKNDSLSINFKINSDTTIRLNYGVDCSKLSQY